MPDSRHNADTPAGSLLLPKISIVTPSYNQGEFLEECIDSILGQNYPNLEYVIMDGGSTDNSVAIIKKYEKHLAYWQSQPDGGQYQAITGGFARTSGEVMAWLNSDDKYHAGALWRTAYTFVNYPEVDWFTGRHTSWDAQGNLASCASRLFRWSREVLLEMDLNPDSDATFIQQESTFWRRRLWQQADAFLDGTYDLAGDFDLWIRFLRHARLYSLDALIAGYRFHDGQKVGHDRTRYLQQATAIQKRERQLVADGRFTESLSQPAPISLYTGAVEEYRTTIEADYRGQEGGQARGLESLSITTTSPGKAGDAPGAVTVATSIAPFNLEKQRAAIDSWIACGFRVVSLNVAAEIQQLKEAFSDVEFVPVLRDGSRESGKPLVYFDDILAHLRTLQGDICGIVNSDIYLVPDRQSVEAILQETRGGMVYGSRVDVPSLQRLMGPVYNAGFDFFFFDHATLSCYPRSGFMLGMPWWDYWAPLMPALHGFPVKYLESPFAYHVEHQRNYLDENFLRLGREFSENLFMHFLAPLRDGFPSISPQINYEVDVNKLVPHTVHYLHTLSTHIRVTRLETAAMNARGEAYLETGEAEWAEVWFKRALGRDGRYLPALNNLAVLYWNAGRTEAATEQLGIALEIAPTDRTTVLNCGAVLTALDNIPEARSLYENYLAQCPVDAQMRQLVEALAQNAPAANAMPAG